MRPPVPSKTVCLQFLPPLLQHFAQSTTNRHSTHLRCHHEFASIVALQLDPPNDFGQNNRAETPVTGKHPAISARRVTHHGPLIIGIKRDNPVIRTHPEAILAEKFKECDFELARMVGINQSRPTFRTFADAVCAGAGIFYADRCPLGQTVIGVSVAHALALKKLRD